MNSSSIGRDNPVLAKVFSSSRLLLGRGFGTFAQAAAFAVTARTWNASEVGDLQIYYSSVLVLAGTMGLGQHYASHRLMALGGLSRSSLRVLQRRVGFASVAVGFVGVAAGIFGAPWAVLGIVAGAAVLAQMRVATESLKAIGKGPAALTLEFGLPFLVLMVVAAAKYSVLGGLLAWHGLLIGLTASLAVAGTWVAMSLTEGRSGHHKSLLDVPEVRPWLGAGLVETLKVALPAVPFVLGARFVTSDELGSLAVFMKVLGICAVVQVAFAADFLPRFAYAHTRGNRDEVRRLLRLSQVTVGAIVLPLLLLAVVVRRPIADMFEVSPLAMLLLLALVLGQMVNALTGLSSELLIGIERSHLDAFANFLGVITALVITYGGGPYGLSAVILGFVVGLSVRHGLAYLFSILALRSRC